MVITLESTDKELRVGGALCRVWKGRTASGVECYAFVARVQVASGGDPEEFKRELETITHAPPGEVL